MDLDLRDRSTVTLVSKFSQLSSSHIHSLVFNGASSHTPTYRTLTRLVERKYLARIERRVVGGAHGGAGQYVYQLGPEGHRLFREGRYVPARSISYHSLAIAQCFVALVDLEREGRLEIAGYSTEPDCYQTIGRHELKPDFYAELRRPETGKTIKLMFEIDMASQGQRQIIGKFERYWGAYSVAGPGEWDDDKYVLFVAVDDHRADELRWLLSKGSEDQRTLFKVTTGSELSTALA